MKNNYPVYIPDVEERILIPHNMGGSMGNENFQFPIPAITDWEPSHVTMKDGSTAIYYTATNLTGRTKMHRLKQDVIEIYEYLDWKYG